MSTLRAFGRYLPERVVGNDELAAELGVDPAWIVKSCGIEQRRYAAETETLVDLGCAAALDCLRNAGVGIQAIGFLLVSSGSAEVFCPGPASAIASRLGMGNIPAIDVPVASAGSIAALVLAESLAERFGNVLVVATEIMSRRVSRTPEGKDTAMLFGDGAGACLVAGEASEDAGFARIAGVALHADGELAGVISVHEGRFGMEGMAVIRHASGKLPEVIGEVLTAQGIAAGDVEVFLVHQANLRLLERVAKTLGVANERLFKNIQRYGNTSSASLLIAAAEWFAGAGKLNGPMVMAAFGSGLTWGALAAVPILP
jgi:3-oxoacyl-[acyl-carrier-protein] synthase-3